MNIIMTEAEPQRLGSNIDSSNPSQVAPVNSDDLPDDSWDFERLMSYSSEAVCESGRLLTEATCLSRRSTVQIYRAGRALTLARNKLPPGQAWGACLKAHNIPRTNAWEAMQLFERASSEAAVASLTPSEAKLQFGITQPKKSDGVDDCASPKIIPFRPTIEDEEAFASEYSPQENDCLDVASSVDNVDSDGELPESAEVAESNVVDEAEPADHEPESVLRLLVKINAALTLATTISVLDKERDQIEIEIHEAHKLLDEIEVV